ncbi:MAG TPA: hypothetical protein VKB65_06425 [Myxococcota bacterium]|nr:hypothetical protein [Myxococcota bacterium]
MCPDDREKLSFSELDRLRRERKQGGGEHRPRGPGAEARSKQATDAYLKEADNLFTAAPGGAEGEALARAVRSAHGTADLADACRAYRDAVGMPDDPALLSLFLDADDPAIVAETIRALAEAHGAGRVQVSRGIKSQLRVLEQNTDDDVAYEAEELLARL